MFQNLNGPEERVFNWLGLRLSGGNKSEETELQGESLLDLERVLFSLCVYLGQNKKEGRLASVLKSWFKVHGDRVNIGKLSKLKKDYFKETGEDPEFLRYFAYYNYKDLKRHPWEPLTMSLKKGGENFYAFSNEKMSKLALKRFGLESFLPKNSPLKVHDGAFREREEDVLSPKELAKVNKQYYNRVMFGNSPRADVFTFHKEPLLASTKALAEFINYDSETVRKTRKDLVFVEGIEA